MRGVAGRCTMHRCFSAGARRSRLQKMGKISKIKGFADLYEPESTLFTYMENEARRVFTAYGYAELRVPVLEYTELFQRGIGTETDIVQKEMFTFPDRKGRSLTMRPECTAGIMRSYIENQVYAQDQVSKFFSFGPMFRYERPQKGRMRQFHQLDCECLNVEAPHVDAEMILMVMDYLGAIGLTGLSLELNSLGCGDCRPAYRETLRAFLRAIDKNTFCENCQRRIETNPLRVLDCKVPACKEATKDAPAILEHLCSPCKEHFAVVVAVLDERKVPYFLNNRLVRGLDYYSRTTFEVVSSSIGAQGSVAGGGRYDGLVKQLGGPDVPGIGFAMGMERLALMLEEAKPREFVERPDFFVAVLDSVGRAAGLGVAQTLRGAGFSGQVAFEAKSLKSQMRQASKMNARYCLILGTDELRDGKIVIKNMDSGEQRVCGLEAVSDELGK